MVRRAGMKQVWHTYSGNDWLVLVGVWLLVGIWTFAVPVHRRFIFALDSTISYPLLDSTVPTWLLAVLACVLPIVLALIAYLYFRTHVAAKYELNLFLTGLLLALGLATLFTTIIKRAVGRPRPNFAAYCHYENNACNGVSLAVMNDAYASFPSGHSSFAFSGLGFTAMYLMMCLPSWRRAVQYLPRRSGEHITEIALSEERHSKEAWVFVLAISPLFLAGFIAMTRITDYWHNTDDVVFGSMLGIAFAMFVAHFKLSASVFAPPPLVPVAALTPAMSPSMSPMDSPRFPEAELSRNEKSTSESREIISIVVN